MTYVETPARNASVRVPHAHDFNLVAGVLDTKVENLLILIDDSLNEPGPKQPVVNYKVAYSNCGTVYTFSVKTPPFVKGSPEKFGIFGKITSDSLHALEITLQPMEVQILVRDIP